MTGFEARGVSLSYPGQPRPALEHVTLPLFPGSITALLGPSGCGKTSLAKVIAGLQRPSAGRVFADAADITDLAPEQRGVVMMLQQAFLFPHLSVAENVGFALKMRGRPEQPAEVEAMLARVQLSGYGPRRTYQLSGGEAQRVALARALMARPRLLLLDEPLSSLDPGLRDDMRDLISRLIAESGTTALFITHDRAEAVAVASRLAVMIEGKLAQTGTAEDLFERPQSAAVARFLGNSNCLTGAFSANGFQLAGHTLPLKGPAGHGRITLRPEAIRFSDTGLAATVEDAAYRGSHWQITLRLADGQQLTAHSLERPAAIGRAVHLDLPTDRLAILPPDD